MSETYSIHCHTCCVSLWIGQEPNGGPFRFYLYGGNCASGQGVNFSPLAEFLIMHQNHPLKFCSSNEETDPEIDYLPLDDKPGLPVDDAEITTLFVDPIDPDEADQIERMRQAYATNRIIPATATD